MIPLTVLILTVLSTCLAHTVNNNAAARQRPARAPQSQIQYHDPDGLRVDWKLYAPQNQWKSHLVAVQRAQRAETGTGQANLGVQTHSQVVQAPIEQKTQYQPYSAIPNHIKQLLGQVYAPQPPYVDPGAFFYQAKVPIALPLIQQVKDDKSQSPTEIERDYFSSAVTYGAHNYQQTEQQNSQQIGRIPSKVGGIKYKNENRVSERNAQQLPYGSVLTAQSEPKPQYQPYKHISQLQYQALNKQVAQPQLQYQLVNKQVAQPQLQYQVVNKQVAQPQLQYQVVNKQVAQPQLQYQVVNKQVPQQQLQYQAFNKQASQPHLHYQTFNKQVAQQQLQYQASNKQPFQPQPQYQPLNQQPQLHFKKPKLLSNIDAQKASSVSMPMAIQQLLNYQSQLPYHVIANHIHYHPKELFVPKPLPESVKLARRYPSKIYFVKTNGQVYESPDMVKDSGAEKRF